MPPQVPRVLAAAVALLALLAGCVTGRAETAPSIVVGYGSTTEQRVLAALTVYALQEAGLRAEIREVEGVTVALRRQALSGVAGLYWDYTGAAWGLGMDGQAPPADPTESYERVRRADEANGLVWLQPSQANATLALFVRAEDRPPEAEPRGMAWLAGELSSGRGRLCADRDFISRAGGLESLAAAYAMDLNRVDRVPASENEAIAAVAGGRCFAGLGTATSGVARNAGLVPVTDDLRVFPAFVVAPVAREAALERVPGLAAAIEPVARLLDTASLASLNARYEAGVDPERIAEEYLAEELGA